MDSLVREVSLKKFNRTHGKRVIGMTPEALNACLKKYSWPGNIRELENVIEYAFIWENENRISVKSLPDKVLEAAGIQGDGDDMEDAMDLEMTGLSGEMSAEGGLQGALQGSMLGHLSDTALDFNKQKEQFEKSSSSKL